MAARAGKLARSSGSKQARRNVASPNFEQPIEEPRRTDTTAKAAQRGLDEPAATRSLSPIREGSVDVSARPAPRRLSLNRDSTKLTKHKNLYLKFLLKMFCGDKQQNVRNRLKLV